MIVKSLEAPKNLMSELNGYLFKTNRRITPVFLLLELILFR